jgi:hypothetical protein
MTKKTRDLAFIVFATSLVWIFYEIFSQINRSALPDVDATVSAPFTSEIDQNVIDNLESREPY